MRLRPFLLANLTLVALPALSMFPLACGSAPGDGAGSSKQAAGSDADLATARSMLKLLGDADSGKCVTCHEANLKSWGATMKAVDDRCLDPALTLTDVQRVDCLRSTPGDATTPFSAAALGLYSAAVTLPEMQALFQRAYPTGWQAKYKELQLGAKMPKSGKQLLPAEWSAIKTWVLAGMPRLDDAMVPDTGPTSCTDAVSPRMVQHLKDMKTTGWGAVNADRGITMFGCDAVTDPSQCLATFADVTPSIGDGALPQTIRKLRDLPYKTHYWVRSSADGRYVGAGLFDNQRAGARIMDLQAVARGSGAPDVNVDAQYDPNFLPDNDGFSFAGAGAGGQIEVCKQSLLADLASSATPEVTFAESKCLGVSRDVYQSIGASLDGKKYFVTYGSHQNDDGGNQIKAPLSGEFKAAAALTVIPMVNDGAGSYLAKSPLTLATPYEGDVQMSASTQVLMLRFGANGHRLGYDLRFLDATPAGDSYTIAAPLGATVCLKGAKAQLSYDERVLVTHQYVDATEDDQTALPAGSSNIVLADLATGTKARITKMGAGQFALYPHFRSDGWLYFLVRDMNTRTEYLAATDVALHLPPLP